MPVLELIASVASSSPGDDGLYRIQTPESTIRRYLRVARNHHALLLLDIQPGRSSFAEEASRLDRFLREPDVGLALDPEWHVAPDEIPGQVIGSVDADTVNRISAHLAAVTAQAQLPQKLFVVHQFTVGMISNRDQLIARPGLATVINVDGFGDRAEQDLEVQGPLSAGEQRAVRRTQALLQRGRRSDEPGARAEARSLRRT